MADVWWLVGWCRLAYVYWAVGWRLMYDSCMCVCDLCMIIVWFLHECCMICKFVSRTCVCCVQMHVGASTSTTFVTSTKSELLRPMATQLSIYTCLASKCLRILRANCCAPWTAKGLHVWTCFSQRTEAPLPVGKPLLCASTPEAATAATKWNMIVV